MVSRHNIVLVPEGIHHLLYSHKFVVGPKVGDIAAEEHEIQTLLTVDILNTIA